MLPLLLLLLLLLLLPFFLLLALLLPPTATREETAEETPGVDGPVGFRVRRGEGEGEEGLAAALARPVAERPRLEERARAFVELTGIGVLGRELYTPNRRNRQRATREEGRKESQRMDGTDGWID